MTHSPILLYCRCWMQWASCAFIARARCTRWYEEIQDVTFKDKCRESDRSFKNENQNGYVLLYPYGWLDLSWPPSHPSHLIFFTSFSPTLAFYPGKMDILKWPVDTILQHSDASVCSIMYWNPLERGNIIRICVNFKGLIGLYTIGQELIWSERLVKQKNDDEFRWGFDVNRAARIESSTRRVKNLSWDRICSLLFWQRSQYLSV